MARRPRGLGIVGAMTALLAACNAIWGIELPTGDGGADVTSDRTVLDATTDASADGRADRSASDVEASALDTADAGPPLCPEAGIEDVHFSGPCPNSALPVMGKVPDVLAESGAPGQPFCMDGTEVTNAEYAAFVKDAGTPPMPCECAWKTTLTHEKPGLQQNDPVYMVDWCDAYAYCKWAGKRLCGAVGGGPLPWMMGGTPVDQFYVACGGPYLEPYPYGSLFAPKNCNVPGAFSGLLQAAGTDINCKISYTKPLYDLVGNVAEWIDSCASRSGATDECRVAGGALDSPDAAANATCDYGAAVPRNTLQYDIGFRCCWP